MLPRIVLLIIQIAAAWFLAEPIKSILPQVFGRQYDILIYAALYALIIMVVGFAGALVLKGVRVPTGATFVFSLVLACVMAGLTLIDPIRTAIDAVVPLLRANHKIYVLAGALIGYLVKR